MYLHTGGGGYGTANLANLASILKFDTVSLSWSQVGEMAQARIYHGASVVRAADVEHFCDLGISIFSEFSVPLHYVSIIMQL